MSHTCGNTGRRQELPCINCDCDSSARPEGSIARCEWIEDSNGTWDTGCGNAFEITEGAPTDNNFKFCCYCGGALVEMPFRIDCD